MKWILCMYSGGLDSTGALYSLLTKPEYNDYNIHVHHMHLGNIENRAGAERQAVKNCINWFKDNCREFHYDSSVYEYNFMGTKFIWDADITGFMVGRITYHLPRDYKYAVVGRTKTDSVENHSNFGNRAERAMHLMGTAFMDGDKDKPEYLFLVKNMTKQEIWDMLPEDLRKLTWSCRYPVRLDSVMDRPYVPCGRCITCEDMKKMELGNG